MLFRSVLDCLEQMQLTELKDRHIAALSGGQLQRVLGQMHGPNECANEEQLKQALKIYIVAILRLNELEL